MFSVCLVFLEVESVLFSVLLSRESKSLILLIALLKGVSSEKRVNSVPAIIKTPINTNIAAEAAVSPDKTLSTIFSESDADTINPAIMNKIPNAISAKLRTLCFLDELSKIFVNLFTNGTSIFKSESSDFGVLPFVSLDLSVIF